MANFVDLRTKEHDAAVADCRRIFDAAAAAQTRLAELQKQLSNAKRDASEAAADELMNGGATTAVKRPASISKLENEIADQRDVLTVLRQRHGNACATAQHALIALRRAEAALADSQRAAHGQAAAELEAQAKMARNAESAAGADHSQLANEIEELSRDSAAAIGFRRGTTDELAALTQDPTVAIDGQALAAKVDELRRGWLATRDDGTRIAVRAKDASLYWDKATGELLACDILKAESVENPGSYVGQLSELLSPFGYDPNRRRRELKISGATV